MDNLQIITLSTSIEENINIIKTLFESDDTLILRRFRNHNNPKVEFCIFFINGMVNEDIVNKSILLPIIYLEKSDKISSLDFIKDQVIVSSQVTKTSDYSKIITSIVSGDTVLIVDGVNEALSIDSKGWPSRQITEPDVERTLRGPREGFTESLNINLTLIRRKVQSNKLKFEYMKLGKQTNTNLCICYIEDIVSKDILNELKKRLSQISMDGILAAKYIQEFIDDAPYSVFETTIMTEKPDIVVGKMLEGRIALVVDGTPSVVTLPHLFIENFQSGDDYYINHYFSSIGRIIRTFGFLSSISIPAIYLALVSYHQELIPTPLLISIYNSRLGVPLPSVFELIALLLIFEVLREAGTRMPAQVGQALSIVGALVLGSAAVDAKFVSSPIVIVVGLSGITSLIVPGLTSAVLITKLILTFLSAVYGLYGYIIGMAFLLLHLFKIRSFNTPFMTGLMVYKPQDLKDTIVRVPWWRMIYRPRFIGQKNPRRNSGGNLDE